MTALYSCRSINAVEYRISKFDADLNLQSSYIMTQEGCDCPQGHKPTCRHRKMLPTFAKEGHIDDGYFYDWDTRMWRKPINEAIDIEPAEVPSPISAVEGAPDVSQANAPSPPVVEPSGSALAPTGVFPKRRKA